MFRNKGIFVYLMLYFIPFILESVKAEFVLGAPDYESQWRLMQAQNWGGCQYIFKHKIGEDPLIVDVQVKSLEDPNMDFKFPAIGGCPRDDDIAEQYGSVCYLYNDEEVIVSAPMAINDHDSGLAIYAANNMYFNGPNNQTSVKAAVKVRAWKASSLPYPDFTKKEMFISAGSTKDWAVYKEVEHGLGSYPGLVNARIKITDGIYEGYYSDAVGANIVTVTSDITSKAAYVVYGFNDKYIRAWVSSDPEGIIFQGLDGWRIPTKVTYGHLEVFAWKENTMPATVHSLTQLGPNVENEKMEMILASTTEDMFVKIWAESLNGPNLGYRFPGSGSLAYVENVQDPVCSYGGLTYSYSTDILRFWRPTGVSNSGIICISDRFGLGINSQRELDAKIVVSVWNIPNKGNIVGKGNQEWIEIEDICVHTEL